MVFPFFIFYCRYTTKRNPHHRATGQVMQAVPTFFSWLTSTDLDHSKKEQVCWALGNIAANAEYRLILLHNGFVGPIVEVNMNISYISLVVFFILQLQGYCM